MKPTTILCPVDFSTFSRGAMQVACEIARDTGARLLLIHVYHYPMVALPEMPMVGADMLERIVASAETTLGAWRRDAVALGAERVESRLLEGVAWDRIVAVARESKADLLVIATQGRTGLRHALLGSVAERVVRHAPCSVLVVKESVPT